MTAFTFEPVTKTAFRVNGGLIDLVAIQHHLETHTWGPHRPHRAVSFVTGWHICAIYDEAYRADPQKQSSLFHFLAVLYNYGLPIPKQSFSVCPGQHPYALWEHPTGAYRKTFVGWTGHTWLLSTEALEVWECTES